MKLTRRQLKNIIIEALGPKYDKYGKLKSVTTTRNLTRDMLPHDYQLPPIPPEWEADEEIKTKLKKLRGEEAEFVKKYSF